MSECIHCCLTDSRRYAHLDCLADEHLFVKGEAPLNKEDVMIRITTRIRQLGYRGPHIFAVEHGQGCHTAYLIMGEARAQASGAGEVGALKSLLRFCTSHSREIFRS